MSHQMPTDADIRARIDRIENEKYRLAFMYQYLIAGRIAEVAGKYGSRGSDAIATAFDGIPAIIFIVRTAKRKGRLRGVAVPLEEKYEPWTKPVYEYFLKQGEDYVFRFAEKWATSIRYMQWKASDTFEGMEWPMVGYTVKKGDAAVKVPRRWKNVTSHVMRKRRTITLMLDYDFDHIDLSLYGGWTIAQSSEGVPQALKNYLYVEPQSSSEPLKLLKKMAGRYFKKLLKTYTP